MINGRHSLEARTGDLFWESFSATASLLSTLLSMSTPPQKAWLDYYRDLNECRLSRLWRLLITASSARSPWQASPIILIITIIIRLAGRQFEKYLDPDRHNHRFSSQINVQNSCADYCKPHKASKVLRYRFFSSHCLTDSDLFWSWDDDYLSELESSGGGDPSEDEYKNGVVVPSSAGRRERIQRSYR